MNKHVLHAYVCKTNILVKHLMCLRLLHITIKSYIKIRWLSIKTFFQVQIYLCFLLCRLFGQDGLCASCEKRIRAFEMTMRVRDKVYHLECFKCAACQKHFCVGDRYLLINSDIVCEQDIFEWTKINGSIV